MEKNPQIMTAIIVINIILLFMVFNLNSKMTDTIEKLDRVAGQLVGIEDRVKSIAGDLWLRN